MNVTRRNNGLAITGTDNEIIALLASLEYGLYGQAGAENTIPGKDAKAATAEYMARHREAKRLRMLAESFQVGTEILPTEWHEVTTKIDRSNLPQPLQFRYIMSNEELDALRTDLESYARSGNAAKHGFYAFVDANSLTPGTAAFAFDGMEITETCAAPDFTPPSSYSISQGAVNIMRTRTRH